MQTATQAPPIMSPHIETAPFELVEREDQPVTARPPTMSAQSITPADLLRIAVERGDVDLDRLERLANMVREWKAEEAKLAFARDFATFTALGIVIPKTKHVEQRAKGGGPGPRYDQTEYHVVSGLLKPPLGKLGFGVSFDNKFERAKDGGIAWCRVTCVLEHRDGFKKEQTLEGPPDDSGAKNPLQEMQSSATFLMRHALMAITGTSQAGMDNDGRGARGARDDRDTDLSGLLRTLIQQGRATKTDKEALDFWNIEKAKLDRDPAAYKEFKDQIAAHRVELSEAAK